MKNKKLLVGILSLSLLTMSCNKDDDSQAIKEDNLKIIAKSTYLSNKTGSNFRVNSTVVLSLFKINIKEIEFDMDDDFTTGDGFYGDDDDIELKGPFELNLLNGTTELTALNIPNGIYEEVEFKMYKNNSSTSDMYNKSIKIEGTIDGKPFTFWHNVEEDFEIDYEDTNQNLIVTDNSNTSIIFDFDLNSVISSIDFSSALDGNNNGIIEINPNDLDGNQSLANQIKDKIKDSCELDD